MVAAGLLALALTLPNRLLHCIAVLHMWRLLYVGVGPQRPRNQPPVVRARSAPLHQLHSVSYPTLYGCSRTPVPLFKVIKAVEPAATVHKCVCALDIDALVLLARKWLSCFAWCPRFVFCGVKCRLTAL